MPSIPAIEQQNVRRACIQAGYLWKLSQLELDRHDPTFWGWKLIFQYRNFPISPYGKIVIRLMSILYWKLVCVLKDHVTTVLANKRNSYMKFCKCEESNCKNRLNKLKRFNIGFVYWISLRRTRSNYVFKRSITVLFVLFDLYE